MRSSSVCALSLLLALACLVASVAAASLPVVSFSPSWSVAQSSRVISLQTHIEDVANGLRMRNTGSAANNKFIVAIAGDKADRLAFFEASSTDGKQKYAARPVALNGLPAASAPDSLTNASFYEVTLPKMVGAGETAEVRLLETYTRTLRPFPAQIEQNQNQLVMWSDSSLLFSPYPVLSQDVQVMLAKDPYTKKATVESFTKKHAKKTPDSIHYGPISAESAPFARQPIQIHFVNNAPFVTFTKVSKDIEVSHWGNVAIQDNYLLTHTGAALKGEFTRADYEQKMRGAAVAPASFRTLVADLPRTAKDVYFRDCIGNVSTSHVRRPGPRDAYTRMEVDPRFPMFGGWSSDFHIGYNLPSQHYLSVDNADPDRYVLNISFAVPFASAAIDSHTVRVILPEGATDIEWVTPFDIDSASFTEFKTYLDTVGRPTLILQKNNCVASKHQQNFQVVYRFGRVAILREPLLVSIALFACLAVVMAFYHADLRITDESASADADAAITGSALRSRRTGTLLGEQVQEILENLMAAPNGLLAVTDSISRGRAPTEKHNLLSSLIKEITAALQAIQKEEAAFAPLVTTLTGSMSLLSKACKKHAAAQAAEAATGSSQEVKASREQLAEIVEQIHVQAKKLAEM